MPDNKFNVKQCLTYGFDYQTHGSFFSNRVSKYNDTCDKSENIWLLDGPIGRLDFIKISILIILWESAMYVLVVTLEAPIILLRISLIICGYVGVFAIIKRHWDILGSVKPAIFLFIILAIISAFVPFFSGLWFSALLLAPDRN